MEDILLGTVDRTITVFIPDPASTDGSGKTGLVAADLTVSYTRVETDNDVTVSDVTSSLNNLSALTDAHNDWGLKEVSNTLAPGLYRLDIADAVFASGAWYAVVYVMITSSAAAATPKAFRLVAFNALDGVRLGLTALPNAAAEAAGGLYTRGTGAGQINQAANGMIDTNPVRLNNVSQSLLDLKDFADDGYDPSTNKVQGVVLADTVTTYTGNTLQTGDSFTRIGAAGAGLTNIDLPNQTMDITGSLSGSVGSVTGAVGSVTGNVGGNVVGSVASVTAGVTLAAAAVQAIWDALTSALTTAGSIGKLLVDNINATISSRLASASYTAPPTVGEVADQVWDEAIAGHAGAGSTGAALSAAGSAGDPWSTALPGAYGAGTAGKIVGDNLNATVGSRATQTSVDAVQADTDNIQARLPAALVSGRMDASVGAMATDTLTAAALAADAVTEIQSGLSTLNAAGVRTAVGLASANLDVQLDALPTAAEVATAVGAPSAAVIADAVWDEDATAHQTQGTFGQAIGDPGADTDTIFGLINTNLDAAVSTRLAGAGYTAPPTVVAIRQEVDANSTKLDVATSTRLATAGYTAPLDAAGTRSAVGLASANLDTQLGDLPTNAELATALDPLPTAAEIRAEIDSNSTKLSVAVSTRAVAGDAMALTSGERNSAADAILARALAPESYAADGAVPTLSQAFWMIWAGLVDFSITGTTLTAKKQDGTAAMTFTLDSSSAPTSRTRAT